MELKIESENRGGVFTDDLERTINKSLWEAKLGNIRKPNSSSVNDDDDDDFTNFWDIYLTFLA